ncbi:probable polyamine transporter At3g13620 [Musa acuminata AAA Group]|uniref:probable polyamine transporter At3g13620 n=1 Tax=Musa acuminata AAA Group TaxID=214697 RepID=UPI0031D39FFD
MSPEFQIHGHQSPRGGGGGGVGGAPQSKESPENMDSSIDLGEAVLPRNTAAKNPNKLTLLPLIFLIYFEVAGGPYGAEPAVQAAGALYALLGFLIFPFVWSIPESLVTAELATAIPGNGGFVLWADRAFGPFCGSLMGTWKFLSGVINSAAFPVLCADYLARVEPSVASGTPRYATVAGMNLALSFLNYTGLTIVGYTAVALGLASLAPFVLMTAMAVPRLRPARWLTRGRGNDWRLFFNTLFWNLNFWDNASTMAGEVERPERTFPTALLSAGLMTSLGYLLPLMAGTGAVDAPQDAWGNGFFADIAGSIAGRWLKYWIEVGAVLSAIGLYEAQLSSSAFQLLGMANLRLLPRIFASRAKWFLTPWAGILTSSLITLAISFMSFNDIINSANFLYGLGMLMEFSAFLWLRKKEPNLKRPYRVPMRLPGLVLLCLVPSAFLIFVMAIASWKVFAICAALTALGIAVYYTMAVCKSRGCLAFMDEEETNGEIGTGDA